MSDQSAEEREDAPEDVEETLDELSETVEGTDEGSETGGEASDEPSTGDGSAVDRDIDELLDRAMGDVDALLTAYESDDPFEEVREDVDDLIEVVEETEELLETVDLADLPEAVDASALPAAIEADDVSDAIAAGDPGEGVEYRKLLRIVELGDLWDAVDVREFWRNKRELEDAAGDVTDDGAAADDGTDPMETLRDFVGEDWSDADAGSGSGDGAGNDAIDVDTGPGGDGEREDVEVPTEAIQQRVQSRLSGAVGEFRESLLDTRDRIEKLKQENENRTGDVEQPDSRNPTAYSSVPTARTDMSGTAAFSTVPEETRYSTAPNRPRLYGSRLDRAGGDDDE